MATLSDYDLDLNEIQEDPKSAIRKVLGAFKDAVKSYRATAETTSTGVKQAVNTVQEDEFVTSSHEELTDNLRSLIYRTLTSSPLVSILLFDSLQEIKEGVASFRQEAMKQLTIEDDDGEGVDVEAQQAKYEEVEFLHKALGNFVNFAQMNGMSILDLPADLKHDNKKTKKTEVRLPRKPNGPSDSDSAPSTKGRHASIYKMHYAINGEEVPTGTSLNRLALFYCSTPEEWWNGADLMTHVEKVTGDSWGAGSWEVNVPAGILSAEKREQ